MSPQRLRFEVLRPWSRRWWAAWHCRVARGESVKGMVDSAGRGVGYQVATSDSDFDFVAVQVDSDAFHTWREYYAHLGATLPRPRFAPVIFAPSLRPPQSGDHLG